MTIVCATHFTDSSSLAVRVAAELATRRGEPLFLVNVQEGSANAPHGQELETAAFNALQLDAAALSTERLKVGFSVVRGPLGPSVWQYCDEQKATLLVVGDTNHLTSALFESSLDQFAYGVDVPLLVVRDDTPLLEWARGSARLKVLLALDRTWTSALARDWIGELAEYGPIDLIAAHIWWPREEYVRSGLEVPRNGAGHEAVEERLRHDTEAALAGLPPNVNHRVHLEIGLGHIGERLLALSVEEHVDMLVVGTHPRRGPLGRLWSVSHDVLGLAPMSVVCVPGGVAPPAARAPSR